MRRHVLIVCTDSRAEPLLLADAVDDVLARARRDETTVVRVLIPAVVPPTLPISAWPPRLAERIERLRTAAGERGASHTPRPRVEVVPCRSIRALLDAHPQVDALVLVGGTGWSVRRAARGVAADVTAVPSRRTRKPEPGRAPLHEALPGSR
jgi:hypothetical protein